MIPSERMKEGIIRTLVAWHRFGKEHAEDGFRVNSPEVVEEYVKDKVDRFKGTPSDDWKWFQISSEVIIEQPFRGRPMCGPDTTIYYLPSRMWCVQENVRFPHLGEDWIWYVHIGRTEYISKLQAWVFRDLFVDVIIKADSMTYRILDLGDLADVYQMGLIGGSELVEILRRTQELIDLIEKGEFPPKELQNRKEVKSSLGW